MNLGKIADIMETTLAEEETDALLTDIAEEFINMEADGEQTYSWQQQKDGYLDI